MRSVLRPAFGALLHDWRRRRSRSQLHLALDAEISQKHLSFIESGRSTPSRDMVLRLAEALNIPLRERNALLLAAGFAPTYPLRSLQDPELEPARAAINLLLEGHEPFPALAVDRHWTMIAANKTLTTILAEAVSTHLLAPPINVLRLTLHPEGLAPRVVNYSAWREHLFKRLDDQIRATADSGLIALLDELRGYPAPENRRGSFEFPSASEVLVPMMLDLPAGQLSFISTMTVFGSPIDITLSEIAIEAFFPANDATRRMLMARSGSVTEIERAAP